MYALMASAGDHRKYPGQSRQTGGGDDGDGGGGACGRAGGGVSCTHHACDCKMGSPETPKGSARTRKLEGVGLDQSGGGRVMARD